jgi:hypothetical protein
MKEISKMWNKLGYQISGDADCLIFLRELRSYKERIVLDFNKRTCSKTICNRTNASKSGFTIDEIEILGKTIKIVEVNDD